MLQMHTDPTLYSRELNAKRRKITSESDLWNLPFDYIKDGGELEKKTQQATKEIMEGGINEKY